MPIKNPEKRREAQRRADEKRKGRTRNFATIVYPESAPPDWMQRLEDTHVRALISPLHDADENPDGTPKKAHYHVLLMFDAVQDFKRQVEPIFEEIGGVGRENVKSARGYARYLCHLDNPEKFQYAPEDVKALNGADFLELVQLPTDRYSSIGEMMDWVDANGCVSYADLARYARAERQDWFRILCNSGTVVMKEYIHSVFWEAARKDGGSGK